MTIPQGFDPIFPNKRIIGYNEWGKPIYDMAATGAVSWAASMNSDGIFNAPPRLQGDMIPEYRHGCWWHYYAAMMEYERKLNVKNEE